MTTVSLRKNQTISLRKEQGPQLTQVALGLGWEGIPRKGLFGFGGGREAVDLDANALLFDASGKLVDAVWFKHLDSEDGSLHHSGDNRTGDGKGDDETITVDLTRVPAAVTTIVFTVNNYSGQDFSRVEEARCRLIDTVSGDVIAQYNLSAGGPHTALIMAKLTRQGAAWALTSIGETARGRTYHENLPDIRRHL